MTTVPASGGPPVPDRSLLDRRLPPVAEMAVGSMALVIVGGIYLAAHLPHGAPLGAAVGLLAAGGALMVGAVVSLSRVRPFAWSTFFLVVRWALLAYLVITGLLEFVFVFDGTRGSTLVVLTLMLAVFAVDVPLVIGFTVARYQAVERR
jgi:hypothetical protein